MSADFNTLTGYLQRWDQRRRQQDFLTWLPRALLIGFLVMLGVIAISRIRPLFTRAEIGLIAVLVLVVAIFLTAIIVLTRRRSILEKARFADRQFRLRERATAAVEIHAGEVLTSSDLAAMQLGDTLRIASEIDLERSMPLKLRSAMWLPVTFALALLALSLWLPNPQETLLLEQRAVAAAVAEQAAGLEQLAETIAANENLTAEQQAALQEPLAEAADALANGSLSREEAVGALSEAETELRSLEAQFNNQALQDTLAQTAPSLAQTEAAASLAQTLENRDLGAVAEATSELAGELESLDHEAQQSLAESLAETAATLQSSEAELAEQFQAAAEALAGGDTESAAEALEQAAAALQEEAQGQQAAAQARQTASAMSASRQAVAQAGSQPAAADGQLTESGPQGDTGAEAGGDENGQSAGAGDNQSGDGTIGQGSGSEQQPGSGGPGQGGGRTENVFVPPSVDLSQAGGVDVELPSQCLGDPDACGPPGEPLPTGVDDPVTGGSMVPFQRVIGIYRTTVNEALSRGDIPLGLQGLVRNYFSSLEP